MNNYEKRELRIRLRMNSTSKQHPFSGFVYEGKIVDVNYSKNKLLVTLVDAMFNDKKIIVKFLAYNKSVFDSSYEYEIIGIENNKRKDF